MSRTVMASIRWAFNSANWHPNQSEWAKVAQCIQPEEKERIGRFMFKRDAKASMVGRLMLRRLIHRVLKLPYKDIQFGRTEKGKPYLQNDVPCEGLSFNVSHQGEYVVLAAESHSNLGVDVMNSETPRGRSLSEFFHTMKNQFTTEEWTCIRSHASEADQLKTFYRLWCLKESYVKALGVGIGFEVKRLNFDLVTPLLENGICEPVCDTRLRVDSEELKTWRFEESMIDNHCIAVAVFHKTQSKGHDSLVPFKMLSVEQLLDCCDSLTETDEEYAETFINKDEDPFSRKQNKS